MIQHVSYSLHENVSSLASRVIPVNVFGGQCLALTDSTKSVQKDVFLELKETLKETQQEVLIETHDTLEKLNRN